MNSIKKNPGTHGGKRAGAGRKPGTLNKRTQELIAKASADGITPIEVLLTIMRKAYEAGDFKEAAERARDAAPYCHPRLAAIEQKLEAKVQQTISEKPLSDEEWEREFGELASPAGAAVRPN